jgi:uncharacterized membrane protein SpoIIM required for sporulation
MDEREFVAARKESWDRLGGIVDRAGGTHGLRKLSKDELGELGPLYRRTASDLAYARAHSISPRLVFQINQLVARTYALLYQTDTRTWSGLLRFFTHDFPQTFRRRMAFFLTALGLTVAGFFVAYALVAHSRDNIDFFVPPGNPFRDSLDYWETGKTSRAIPDTHAALGASFYMTHNTQVSFVAFAGGILAGIPTAFLMWQNGQMLGAFAGVMTHSHQHGNFWPGIVPHGIVEITALLISGAAGLSLGWAILAPGAYRRKDALVIAARDVAKLIVGTICLFIFAGFVEAFVSHSLLPKPLKIGFGALSGVALYAYLFRAGRSGVALTMDDGR